VEKRKVHSLNKVR